MGKLKTRSPMYCIEDNSANESNCKHTLDRIYMTSILLIQRIQTVSDIGQKTTITIVRK